MRSLISIAVGALALATSATAQVTFVHQAATGAQNGSSWQDAYTDLQAALAATSQGEIWVARGTYLPGAVGNPSATFQLKSDVALYGGFAGGETSLSQRDVSANPTILSGDLDQNDTYGVGLNWWQFGWTGSIGNSYHVVTGSGVDPTAILDGFTILAGRGSDPLVPGGAGLLVQVGSPTLRRCTFQYNAVGFGASARLEDCNSTFEQCTIRDAYTCNCGSGGWTSGILCLGSSQLVFLDCDFINHYYVSSMSQGRGAALSIDFGSTADLQRCRFIGNQTGNFYAIGGGTAYGGGVFAAGDITIDRCEFVENFAHAGAGVTAWGDATITNSLFARNQAVPHPNTSGFDDGNYGAGLLTLGSSSNVVSVINCTFVDNNCDKGAGMALYGASVPIVRNCVVYSNYAYPQLPGEDPIFILKQQLVGSYDIANSCVEGLLTTEPGEDPPDASNFPGCFDMPPELSDLAGGDYHLSPTSPCISSGDDAALPPGIVLDLEGNPRSIGVLDMGCYEFQGNASPSLVSTNLVENSPASYTVFNAQPGEAVYLMYSLVGAGGGPCFPRSIPLCLDLEPPLGRLGLRFADSSGRADLNLVVPPGTPLVDTWVQAVILRGPKLTGSVLTRTVHQKINAEP